MTNRERLGDQYHPPVSMLDLLRRPINALAEHRVKNRAADLHARQQPIQLSAIGFAEYLDVSYDDDGTCNVSHEVLTADFNREISNYVLVQIAGDGKGGVTEVVASGNVADHHGSPLEERTYYKTGTKGRKNTLRASRVLGVLDKALAANTESLEDMPVLH